MKNKQFFSFARLELYEESCGENVNRLKVFGKQICRYKSFL